MSRKFFIVYIFDIFIQKGWRITTVVVNFIKQTIHQRDKYNNHDDKTTLDVNVIMLVMLKQIVVVYKDIEIETRQFQCSRFILNFCFADFIIFLDEQEGRNIKYKSHDRALIFNKFDGNIAGKQWITFKRAHWHSSWQFRFQ